MCVKYNTFKYFHSLIKPLTSCMIISFCDNLVRRPLSCTTSRFCHKLNERALFLSCSWTAGGATILDPATSVPVRTPGERLSSCRRCSISCCLVVSRYSWYRKAERLKEILRILYCLYTDIKTLKAEGCTIDYTVMRKAVNQ